jgi:nitrite reductase (NO-forming)
MVNAGNVLARLRPDAEERSRRARRDVGRDVGPVGFLLVAVAAWAALVGGSFAIVYFFVADRAPEVLASREVNVELSDYRITPDPIVVGPSTDLTFVVSNVGGAQHTLQISNDVGTGRLKPGETAVLEAGVARDGYLVWCSIKGHRELGMEARVIVRED